MLKVGTLQKRVRTEEVEPSTVASEDAPSMRPQVVSSSEERRDVEKTYRRIGDAVPDMTWDENEKVRQGESVYDDDEEDVWWSDLQMRDDMTRDELLRVDHRECRRMSESVETRIFALRCLDRILDDVCDRVRIDDAEKTRKKDEVQTRSQKTGRVDKENTVKFGKIQQMFERNKYCSSKFTTNLFLCLCVCLYCSTILRGHRGRGR